MLEAYGPPLEFHHVARGARQLGSRHPVQPIHWGIRVRPP